MLCSLRMHLRWAICSLTPAPAPSSLGRYDALRRQLRDAELQAETENNEIECRQKAASTVAALSSGAVPLAGAAQAPAAAVAAATALGCELEVRQRRGGGAQH